VQGAIYSRGGTRVDGRLLNRTVLAAAEARGLTVRPGGVDRLIRERDAVTGVVIGGETVSAGAVAIAGGAWSETFGKELGGASRWRRSAGRSSTWACTAPTRAAGR